MDKKRERKFYHGTPDEFIISDNENANLTYEFEKSWLDKIYSWFKDEEFYNEKLKELKEKYNIKDEEV